MKRAFPVVAVGCRAELAHMQEEVLAYLTRHASEPAPTETS
jgi:hypothetical protein